MPSRTRRRGRPARGVGGTKPTHMRRQIAARVPDETHRQLKALAVVLDTSHADVVTEALSALEQTLHPNQRRVVRALVGKQR